MARTAYLHIGTMKSGTTYLQDLWSLNRDELSASGVLWPTAKRYQAVTDLFTWPQDGSDEPNQWAHLEAEVREHSGDLVISNEFLAANRVRRIRRLVDALPAQELRVVITARDLARVIPSHWQTAIKNGGRQTWTEFAESVCRDDTQPSPQTSDDDAASDRRREPRGVAERFWRHHDIAAIIRRWRQVVPPERITLVSVPPAGADPDLLAARFGSVVGVTLTGLSQPDPQSNVSLGAHSAELLRRLNLKMTDAQLDQTRQAFRVALGRSVLSARAGDEPRFALTHEQHDWASTRAERMTRQIRSSGVRVVGDLSDLIPTLRLAEGAVLPEETSETDLLETAGDALIGLAAQWGDLRALFDATMVTAVHRDTGPSGDN